MSTPQVLQPSAGAPLAESTTDLEPSRHPESQTQKRKVSSASQLGEDITSVKRPRTEASDAPGNQDTVQTGSQSKSLDGQENGAANQGPQTDSKHPEDEDADENAPADRNGSFKPKTTYADEKHLKLQNHPGNGSPEEPPPRPRQESIARLSKDPVPPEDTRAETRERRGSEHGQGRRRDFSLEEKKRGQRLFGGLLSTLNQRTSSTKQQKRRQEVEQRQHEKSQQQKAEDDKRRVERLAKLDHARKIEQVRFDEQSMHTRHSSMLAMAHSIKTKSKPTLYYRPWELTKEQEETIRDQIREADATVAREIEEFSKSKKLRLTALGVESPQPSATRDSTVGEPQSTKAPNAMPAAAAESSATNRPPSKHDLEKDQHDENRDVVVETEEDTVIY